MKNQNSKLIHQPLTHKTMNLFKKKKQAPKTVQEIQQEIMDKQFTVLKKFLEANALKYKLKELEVETNELIREWEVLTKLMSETKDKIKEEINDTITNGSKPDSALI